MTDLTDEIALKLRDYVVDGDAESGDYPVEISDLRDILTTMATGAQFAAAVQALLAAADAAGARTAIGAQAAAVALAALAGVTPAADRLPYFDGESSAALAELSAAARGVLAQPTLAAMLSTLGGVPLAGGTMTGALGMPNWVSVASVSTPDIGGAAGNFVLVTGTTTINGFTSAASAVWRVVRFAAALTLAHGETGIICPGGVSIATEANDTMLVKSEGSGVWRVLGYWRASGKALVPHALADLIAGTTEFGRGLLALADGPAGRTAFNAARAGANGDITSLSALTDIAGPLSVANRIKVAGQPVRLDRLPVPGVLRSIHRQHKLVTAATAARLQVTTAEDAIATPGGSYPAAAFRGGVLLPDGRVFLVPYTSTTARIYDPLTNTLSTPSGSYPGSAAHIGGVLMPDGRIFIVPYNSTSARIYDPVTDTLTVAGTFPGSGAYWGGVLLPDGRVYLVPFNATAASIYDPATDSFSTSSGTFPGSSAFAGGVVTAEGKVFIVPSSATSARIYDPATDTLTTPTGTYAGSGAFYGGVLLPNGKIFIVPSNSTSARIYDPATDTLTTPSGTYPGSNAYRGGVLLPDGRVLMVPFNATSARIYDPAADAVSIVPGSFGGNAAHIGGVLMLDGRVFLVPGTAVPAMVIGAYSHRDFNFPMALLVGPTLNKF